MLRAATFVASLIPLLGMHVRAGHRDSLMIRDLLTILGERHFYPRVLDDRCAEDILANYLRTLDPTRTFFTKSDSAELAVHRHTIDDQLKVGGTAFFEHAERVHQERVRRLRSLLDELEREVVDLSIPRWFRNDRADRPWMGEDPEWRVHWRDLARYELDLALWEVDPSVEADLRPPLVLPETIAQQRLKAELASIERCSREERFAKYLSAIAGVFDAQSGYFSPEDEEEWSHAMTRSFVGIGLGLEKRGARLYITALEPGGPAARHGGLAVNDELISLVTNTGEVVEVIGKEVGEVVRLLRGEAGTTVQLTVRNAEGAPRTIPLQRELIHPDDGRAQAWWLSAGDSGSIGCIRLPRFYTDLGNGGGPTSAADVQQCLEQLLQRPLSGLLIDLRNNQGGSMQETIRMLGLFLDAGPVAQRLGRDGSVRVLSIPEGKARYNGPLVVLLDPRSASASEFFAGALQDHGRAVVIGTGHTYGKGTIQTFAELDSIADAQGKQMPAGSVKLTVGMFFRVDGTTPQGQGIKADIVLPDPADVEQPGEIALPFALAHADIAPASGRPTPIRPAASPALIARSGERLRNDSTFILRGALLREALLRRTNGIPLSYEEFRRDLRSQQLEQEKMQDLLRRERYVSTPVNARREGEARSSAGKNNDPVLREGMAVIQDMVLARNTEATTAP